MSAESDAHKKLASWLTFERIVTAGSLLIAAGSILTTIRTLDTRVTKLEMNEERRAETLAEMRGDIKVLLERTDPKGQ